MADRAPKIVFETLGPPGSAPSVLSNYVNGVFVAPSSGQYVSDIDPSTGAEIAKVPRSNADDVAAAAGAAKAAFEVWAKTSVAERAALLDRVADLIDLYKEELAVMEAQDVGKTIRMARQVDIQRAIANFRFFAGQIRHDETGCWAMHDAVNYATREPIGVVGIISPWNLPLYLLSFKVAPALACGNCVIAKPSEVTPRTASALAQILHAVGLPPGVFNLVHGLGSEAGAALVGHPDVHVISFTGGTATGRTVAAIAAPLFKKISLELGGKNATVVFGDVDIDKTVPQVVRAAFTNNGQVCLCGSRIFIQETLYDAFLAKFVAAIKAMRCGPPLESTTDVGPLSNATHHAKVLQYIELARTEGGTIACGGGWPAEVDAPALSGGYFVAPTVVTGLPWSARVAQEEVFGPVVTVHPFRTEDEVVQAVNSVQCEAGQADLLLANTRQARFADGLAGSVWTRDLVTAHRICRRINSGVLWVNCWLHRDLRTPFGGTKASGIGREGGAFSLDFYSEWKNVCVYIGPP